MRKLFENLLISSPNGGGLFFSHGSEVFCLDALNTTGFFYHRDIVLRGFQPNDLCIYDNPAHLIPGASANFNDVHDVLWEGGYCYLVSTAGNEIIKLSRAGDELQRWVFPGDKDSWHINCLCSWRGRIVFSAFGDFREHRGYKGKSLRAGFVQDLLSGERLILGLSQPHSLVAVKDKLFLANSEQRELIEFSADGNILRAKKLDGYTRGIFVLDNTIYVGLSCSRNIEFEGITSATVVALDLETLGELGRLQIPAKEIYAIQHVPDRDDLARVLATIGATSSAILKESLDKHVAQIASLSQAVTERDEQIAGLSQAVTERDSQIASLSQAVTERDGQIASLGQVLTERDGQIASLSQAVAERDGQIASLGQVLTERDGQIASLSQAVAERDGHIAALVGTAEEIYRSNSWRLLAPLRYYGRQRQRLALLLRALPVARTKAGGLLPLFRFALRVWREDGLVAVKTLALRQISHNSASPPRVIPTKESSGVKSGPEILFVSHEASRTGAPIFLLNLARLLKQELGLGCAFLLCSGGVLEQKFRALGPTWVLGNRHVLCPQTLDALRRRDIRLIYSNTATNGAIQLRLRDLDCPILCHVHELSFSIERHFGGENIKSVQNTTDFFLAGSAAVADYLIGQLQLPAEKVAIAHPFVDVASNNRAAAKTVDLLDLPDDAIVVGACGTIGWRKGTDLFIQVARRVLERTGLPIHFVWLGGPLSYGDYPGLQYDVNLLGIADKVSFLGEVDSHLPYFDQLDIFVLPSREDPFPLVALDAASLGLPVVCFSRAGGAPELVENDAGLVVPYLDVERMADSIIQLAEDDVLRRRLGDSARAKVHARHDKSVGGRHIASIVEKYLKLSEKEEI